MNYLKYFAATALILISSLTLAQDDTLLLLDEEPEVKVRIIGTPTPAAPQSDQQVPAAPTPDPKDVFVGIVNSHVLTKEDINARVSARYEELINNVQENYGGVLTVLGGAEINTSGVKSRLTGQNMTSSALKNRVTNENFDEEGNFIVSGTEADHEAELLEGQEEALETAMRRAEEEELQKWIEHNILADEARRQGIIVGESDFRSRLDEAERANNLESADVEAALQMLRISRQDYERFVYDALLIEKLLKRFIDLNYTEEFFRERYNSHPELFYEPKRYLLAHFVITLSGGESRNTLKNLRDKANDVRDRLRKGEDPELIFSDPYFNNLSAGIFGSVPGWFSLYEGYLPPLVEHEARKLEVSETSDVLIQQARGSDGKPVPKSIHVIKILDSRPATGGTFESAMPAIERAMLEVVRAKLLNRLHEAKTHRVITNLGGIPPRLIPSPEELMENQAGASPINLKIPRKSAEQGS